MRMIGQAGAAGIISRGAIEIAPAALADMRREADAAAPRECCGILLARGGVIRDILPAANIAPDPIRLFEIDPATLIAAHRAARAGGPVVAGYYHSHPAGLPVPSAIDRESAAGDGSIWAIVGARDIAFWLDGEAGFQPLSYSRSGG